MPFGAFIARPLIAKRSVLAASGAALAFGLATGVHAQSTDIIGGTVAKDGKWPFVASLVYKNTKNNKDAAFCGATFISPRDLLTAAHCLGWNPDNTNFKQIQVLVGTQDLTTGGRRVDVLSATRHPSYQTNAYDFDIAVLRLKEPVADMKPVGLIETAEMDAQFAPPGRMSMTLGWGDTNPDDGPGAWPDKLMQVKVPIMSNETCQTYSGFENVTENMMCAGYAEGKKDACQGDSGGPLFVYDKKGKRILQAGVVSWGYGCAQPNEPGVYARVSKAAAWIKEQVSKP